MAEFCIQDGGFWMQPLMVIFAVSLGVVLCVGIGVAPTQNDMMGKVLIGAAGVAATSFVGILMLARIRMLSTMRPPIARPVDHTQKLIIMSI